MKHIIYKLLDHIGFVSLNRPEVNAWNQEMKEEWMELCTQINNDLDVKVLVLTGEGHGFCAGEDVRQFAGQTQAALKKQQRFDTQFLRTFLDCRVPVILAAHGFAIGSGAAIMANSDIVLATPETKIGVPELLVGTIGGPEFLDRLMPRKLANYYTLTGKTLTAQDLYDMGGDAIFRLVGKEKLMDEAMEIARKIAAIYGPSVEFTKKIITAREDGLDYNRTVVRSRLSAMTLLGDPARDEQISTPFWKKK